MSKRPARPAGMPWLSPYLTVRDAGAALDFYHRAFGFEKRGDGMTGPDGRIQHAEMAWHDAVIMVGPECTYESNIKAPVTSGVASPVNLYLYCDDVDALFARATKAGAKAVSAPQNMFWGDRMCKVADPDGHQWSFATNVEDFDPSKVP